MRAEGIGTVRRILCVFPRYTSSFGTFEHAYPLTDGVQAFMPPVTLNKFRKPRVSSRLALRLDRCPPAQIMAVGMFFGS